jgi:hypothetical protein
MICIGIIGHAFSRRRAQDIHTGEKKIMDVITIAG